MVDEDLLPTIVISGPAQNTHKTPVTRFISSVRSSYSHPDLILTHPTPLFQITPVLNTGLSLSEALLFWHTLAYSGILYHPNLLLITTPLFQITPVLNTGLSEPLQLFKGYNAI